MPKVEAGHPTPVDYRALLKKYMAHVLACEGTTFTVYSSEWPAEGFTEAEREAIEAISRVICRRD